MQGSSTPSSLSLSRTATVDGLYSYKVRDGSGQSVTASIPGWFRREVTFTCKEAGGLQTNRHESWILPKHIPNSVISLLAKEIAKSGLVGKSPEEAANTLWSIAMPSSRKPEEARLTFSDASPLDAFCKSPTIRDLRAKGTPVTTR